MSSRIKYCPFRCDSNSPRCTFSGRKSCCVITAQLPQQHGRGATTPHTAEANNSSQRPSLLLYRREDKMPRLQETDDRCQSRAQIKLMRSHYVSLSLPSQARGWLDRDGRSITRLIFTTTQKKRINSALCNYKLP